MNPYNQGIDLTRTHQPYSRLQAHANYSTEYPELEEDSNVYGFNSSDQQVGMVDQQGLADIRESPLNKEAVPQNPCLGLNPYVLSDGHDAHEVGVETLNKFFNEYVTKYTAIIKEKSLVTAPKNSQRTSLKGLKEIWLWLKSKLAPTAKSRSAAWNSLLDAQTTRLHSKITHMYAELSKHLRGIQVAINDLNLSKIEKGDLQNILEILPLVDDKFAASQTFIQLHKFFVEKDVQPDAKFIIAIYRNFQAIQFANTREVNLIRENVFGAGLHDSTQLLRENAGTTVNILSSILVKVKLASVTSLDKPHEFLSEQEMRDDKNKSIDELLFLEGVVTHNMQENLKRLNNEEGALAESESYMVQSMIANRDKLLLFLGEEGSGGNSFRAQYRQIFA